MYDKSKNSAKQMEIQVSSGTNTAYLSGEPYSSFPFLVGFVLLSL
jgi:hypothetical protein